MKIIILGANQVGSTLAETLANEANDITVVDADTEKAPRTKRPHRYRHSSRPPCST